MLKQLRIKFIGIMMFFVTVLLVTIFGLILFFANIQMEEQCTQAMQALSSSALRPGLLTDRYDEVHMPYFSVTINHWGEVTAMGGYYDMSDEGKIKRIVQAALATQAPNGLLEEYDVRFSRNIHPFGEGLVFLDVSGQQETMRMLAGGCTVVGIFSFFLFWGLSMLLSKWAIKPVEQAWRQQKQFVADASHELKTPLTVIMTNAELLQTREYEDETSRQFSDSILIMARQMRGLVEGLLELARVDNGAVSAASVKLDFSRLVQESILLFDAVFFEKGLTLAAEIEPGLKTKGSESHLRQVMEILLDNAMKYSDAFGEVSVTLRKHGNHLLLAVSNPGAAISREDLENIFKRFYRVDKARGRDGSYGLGLSIAQSILLEHRGKIWAESENGRNTFFVQLGSME